eukprot:977040-Amphidinium_carterae.1
MCETLLKNCADFSQLLDAGRRRQVLEKLAGWQRSALEVWMIERKRSSRCADIKAIVDGRLEHNVATRACHTPSLMDAVEHVPTGDQFMVEPVAALHAMCDPQHPPVHLHGSSMHHSRPLDISSTGGIRSQRHGSWRTTCYHARIAVGLVEMDVLGRKELSHAIADNIVLVAIKKRVYDMHTGSIYRQRLPRAIPE